MVVLRQAQSCLFLKPGCVLHILGRDLQPLFITEEDIMEGMEDFNCEEKKVESAHPTNITIVHFSDRLS